MSDDHDLADQAIQHGGWLATIVAGIGLWLLKKLMSNQFTILLEEHRKLQIDVHDLIEKVARIEGILRERERRGTWPGDRT